jgi:hypothetical protein
VTIYGRVTADNKGQRSINLAAIAIAASRLIGPPQVRKDRAKMSSATDPTIMHPLANSW